MSEKQKIKVSKEMKEKIIAAKDAGEVAQIIRDEYIRQGLIVVDPEPRE